MSDTKVLTVKMEILLEPTSKQLLIASMVNLIHHIRRPYALSWKPYQGDSLNLPDHRYIIAVTASFQLSQIHTPHAHTQAFKATQRFSCTNHCFDPCGPMVNAAVFEYDR
nr:hypothetical protein [Tanacetum cinerariifolium]